MSAPSRHPTDSSSHIYLWLPRQAKLIHILLGPIVAFTHGIGWTAGYIVKGREKVTSKDIRLFFLQLQLWEVSAGKTLRPTIPFKHLVTEMRGKIWNWVSERQPMPVFWEWFRPLQRWWRYWFHLICRRIDIIMSCSKKWDIGGLSNSIWSGPSYRRFTFTISSWN